MNNQKMLAVFHAAIENEIYVDDLLQKSAELHSVNIPIIRSIKFKKHIEKFGTAFIVFYKLVLFSWPLIQTFLNGFHLVKIFLKKIFRKSRSVSTPVIKLTADLTTLQKERFKNITEKPEISVGFNSRTNNHIFLDFLSFKDIVPIFVLSQRALFSFKGSKKIYRIHSYTAFNFFSVFLALKNIDPKEIWYSNHIDRWAVLIDHVNRCTYKNSTNAERKNVLVQHGIEDGSLVPPTKITNVKKLYLFGADQYQHFEHKILSGLAAEIEIFKSTLAIQDIPKDKTNVLIVGLFFAFGTYEEHIIRLFSKNPEVKVYLKPHPTQGTDFYKQFEGADNFVLITDKAFFPDVDIVVSYNSTLAYEYQMSGKKVIFYSSTIEETLKQIQDEIHTAQQDI